MLTNFRLVIFFALCMLLFSCSKENVSPENEEPQDQPIVRDYELIDLKYFLADGDGIDTTIVKLPDFELPNTGNTLAKQDVKVNYDELMMKSKFMIDTESPLSEGLVPDTFQVQVPFDWYGDGSYGVYTKKTFPLTAGIKEEPYGMTGDETLHLQIPPKSRIVVTAKIDAYLLKCSFRAVFKDRTTGIRDTVMGKWNGTLRYNNSVVRIDEYPLAGKGK